MNKHYEFLTRDPIEFQHLTIILLAKGIDYLEEHKDGMHKIVFDVPEYRLPFEFCYMVN